MPLEEVAAIFGDKDEVVLYLEDIHVDHNTHKLTVEYHENGAEISRVATEPYEKNVVRSEIAEAWKSWQLSMLEAQFTMKTCGRSRSGRVCLVASGFFSNVVTLCKWMYRVCSRRVETCLTEQFRACNSNVEPHLP